jgi:aspartyl-tRNA(Asn)/glutamyl-tRNA(Gln) amidotransferase subunit A
MSSTPQHQSVSRRKAGSLFRPVTPLSAHEAYEAAQRHASLNAFTSLFDPATHARTPDQTGALGGVPIAVKDNICIGPDLRAPGDNTGYGGTTTCASAMLRAYRSPYTATAVQRLIDAGAVLVGKTNMDEFGMGSSTERSIFGPTRNPHDPTRVPGGSSGGSAAAVAAEICECALGSDTGGSIRQPASHCGVVGFKPTYGRISRYGLVAYASSLDQIGPITRTVRQAALIARLMSGHDPFDATTSREEVPGEADPSRAWENACEVPIENLRIGVPAQAHSPANDPDVARVLNETIERFRAAGATIVPVDLPHTDAGIAAYYIIAAAEASSNLARFDGVRYGLRAENVSSLDDLYNRSRSEGFGAEVQRRIMLGTYVLSSGYYDAYYARARKVRRLIYNDYINALSTGPCHALLMPAAPGPAFTIGEKSSDPLAMYLEDVYTVGVNLAGLPAICVPAGGAQRGDVTLPIGMQLVGGPMQEETLLRAARTLEKLVRGDETR